MPIVKVEMLMGKSPEYKKTVLDCIHDGLVESIGIEDWDRFQRIIEFDRNDFEFPSFKSDDFMIIELTVFPGRTKEQKEKVIETIIGNLKSRLSKQGASYEAPYMYLTIKFCLQLPDHIIFLHSPKRSGFIRSL